MQKIGFADALDSVVINDPRYQRDGYIFLRDALDFTTKQQKKIKGVSVRHVTGPELLDGVRQYALKEFGPMVMTVFDSWGIRSCEDIGNMVFNLISAGVFGKTERGFDRRLQERLRFRRGVCETVRTGETSQC